MIDEGGVRLDHDKTILNDPADDYELAQRIVFEPSSLECASLEVWMTTDGATGIGIERWRRIAKRVDARARSGPFGAGFEPRFLPATEVIEYCEAVADGTLVMWAWILGGRLTSTAARLDLGGGLTWEGGIRSNVVPRPLIPLLPTGRLEELTFKPWPRKLTVRRGA
jgi:hypothetical protein